MRLGARVVLMLVLIGSWCCCFFSCLSVPPIHILDAVGFPGCSASSSYNNSGSPTPFYTTPSMAQVQQKMRQAAGSFQPAIGPAPDDAPRASRGSGRGRGRGRGRGKKEKDSEDEGKDGERHGKEPTDGSDADLEEEDQQLQQELSESEDAKGEGNKKAPKRPRSASSPSSKRKTIPTPQKTPRRRKRMTPKKKKTPKLQRALKALKSADQDVTFLNGIWWVICYAYLAYIFCL